MRPPRSQSISGGPSMTTRTAPSISKCPGCSAGRRQQPRARKFTGDPSGSSPLSSASLHLRATQLIAGLAHPKSAIDNRQSSIPFLGRSLRPRLANAHRTTANAHHQAAAPRKSIAIRSRDLPLGASPDQQPDGRIRLTPAGSRCSRKISSPFCFPSPSNRLEVSGKETQPAMNPAQSSPITPFGGLGRPT